MKKIKNILRWITKQLSKETVILSNTSPGYNNLDIPFKVFLGALFRNERDGIEDFEKIYMEYLEAIGGAQVELSIKKLSRYEELRAKIRLVEVSLNLYLVKPTKELFDIIISFDYMHFESGFDASRAIIFIEQIRQQVSQDLIELQSIEARHKKQKDEQSEEGEADYYNLLKSMEIAFRHYIPDTITMREFCSYYVNYKLHLSKIEQQ